MEDVLSKAPRVRLRFSKTGKAKYISHLDLVATIRRALLRAGISLGYSEGFNPHPYISIALPLQVGCGSICELMDFEPAEAVSFGGVRETVNSALPEGIEVLELYGADRKFRDIAWLRVEGVFIYDVPPPADVPERLAERFSSDSIVISKRTKSGVSEADIAPMIRGVSFSVDDTDGAIRINATVSAQNPTVTPGDLLSALKGAYSSAAPDFALFTRIEVFDKDMIVFK